MVLEKRELAEWFKAVSLSFTRFLIATSVRIGYSLSIRVQFNWQNRKLQPSNSWFKSKYSCNNYNELLLIAYKMQIIPDQGREDRHLVWVGNQLCSNHNNPNFRTIRNIVVNHTYQFRYGVQYILVKSRQSTKIRAQVTKINDI